MAAFGESAAPVRRSSRTRSLAIATGVTIAALFGALVVAPPAMADTAPPPEAVNAPATVSADPLPTVAVPLTRLAAGIRAIELVN